MEVLLILLVVVAGICAIAIPAYRRDQRLIAEARGITGDDDVGTGMIRKTISDAVGTMSLSSERRFLDNQSARYAALRDLKALLDSGALSQEEFDLEKVKLLKADA